MDQREIYARHAAEYDALVGAEDAGGRLLPAIEAVAPLADSRVLEVGAGTGRITRLLVARGARVVAFDSAPAMLAIARRHLEAMRGPGSWELHTADARDLPVASGSADVAVAGWVFGHLRYWLPDDWKASIGKALDEMTRALVPGGALIVIETLGTGCVDPRPPSPQLAEYYEWLETERGLTRASIRTDYRFADVATAASTTGFFFGDDFGERVRREGWQSIPECTGLWSRRV